MKFVKKILLEMIPVILGVLIALFISDWKQTRDDKQFMQRMFDSIEMEMQSNVQEFNEILPKQYALIDSLENHLENEKVSVLNILEKANGLQVPTVKNTSWKSFQNAKMELVDFEVISKLTDIEESKQFMHTKVNKFMDYILINSAANDEESKKVLSLHVLNIIDSEEELLKLHQAYLQLKQKVNF